MTQVNKPIPVFGMRVTWINPEDAIRPNFVEDILVGGYGRFTSMTVLSVRERIMGDQHYSPLVTLAGDGVPLRENWLKCSRRPKPPNWQGEICLFDWSYLQPALQILALSTKGKEVAMLVGK